MTQPPPGVGPALSALIERLRERAHREHFDGNDDLEEGPDITWPELGEISDLLTEAADALAALSGSVGGLNAAPPEPQERQDDLGLSIDMLDVDRLRDWANLLLIHGPDISYWGSLHFVTSRMQTIATGMEKAIRDIGTLRALPASPVCAAEKK